MLGHPSPVRHPLPDDQPGRDRRGPPLQRSRDRRPQAALPIQRAQQLPDVHELVILKTDLGASALPTDEDGAVDETGAGIEVIDEVEDLEVGSAADLTVNLAAGKYVLLCNIFDETENEAHYKMGMRIDFTVN